MVRGMRLKNRKADTPVRQLLCRGGQVGRGVTAEPFLVFSGSAGRLALPDKKLYQNSLHSSLLAETFE